MAPTEDERIYADYLRRREEERLRRARQAGEEQRRRARERDDVADAERDRRDLANAQTRMPAQLERWSRATGVPAPDEPEWYKVNRHWIACWFVEGREYHAALPDGRLEVVIIGPAGTLPATTPDELAKSGPTDNHARQVVAEVKAQRARDAADRQRMEQEAAYEAARQQAAEQATARAERDFYIVLGSIGGLVLVTLLLWALSTEAGRSVLGTLVLIAVFIGCITSGGDGPNDD
jgi:hypothetical protein